MSIQNKIAKNLLKNHSELIHTAGWFDTVIEDDVVVEYDRMAIEFNTVNGSVGVECDIADSPELQIIGLQKHANLGTHEGMIFLYDEPTRANFHMASVRMPIDIIFVGSDNRVTKIVPNIQPGTPGHWGMSHTSAVIEVNGGFCNAFKIEVGSEVGNKFSPAFRNVKTGEVVPTPGCHDIDVALEKDAELDNWEDGFVTSDGKFHKRSDLIKLGQLTPKDLPGNMDKVYDQMVENEGDPKIEELPDEPPEIHNIVTDYDGRFHRPGYNGRPREGVIDGVTWRAVDFAGYNADHRQYLSDQGDRIYFSGNDEEPEIDVDLDCHEYLDVFNQYVHDQIKPLSQHDIDTINSCIDEDNPYEITGSVKMGQITPEDMQTWPEETKVLYDKNIEQGKEPKILPDEPPDISKVIQNFITYGRSRLGERLKCGQLEFIMHDLNGSDPDLNYIVDIFKGPELCHLDCSRDAIDGHVGDLILDPYDAYEVEVPDWTSLSDSPYVDTVGALGFACIMSYQNNINLPENILNHLHNGDGTLFFQDGVVTELTDEGVHRDDDFDLEGRMAQEFFPKYPRTDVNPRFQPPNDTQDRFKNHETPDIFNEDQPMDHNFKETDGYDINTYNEDESVVPTRPS